MQRGGFPAKTLVLALFLVGTVYLLYLYNTTLGRLRDAELSAERYRREEETKVAQLQEVMRSKDELQERCDNEKHEFTNRLNSLNQQHKMLKSQYDEHEVEQMRLEQEARRVKEEFEQVEAQRNQEYQQLKQQKDLEISSIRDQLADTQRQNEQLQSQISTLRTQLQNGEQQLVNKNAELQQQQQQQQQQPQQPLGGQNLQQQPQQILHFDPNAQQQQQQQQQQFVQQGFGQQQNQQQAGAGFAQQVGDVANMNMGQNVGLGDQQGVPQQQQQQQPVDNNVPQGGFNAAQNQFEQREQHEQRVDELNQQHQVLPPHNNAQGLARVNPDAAINAQVQDVRGAQPLEVNNEDHQVRPPKIPGMGEEEEEEEEEEEDQDQQDNPLELKQVEAPRNGLQERPMNQVVGAAKRGV